ncbi:hypothetical protein NHH88_22095 [Oxalobacteraceae bacterium OTU3CAMAD1]|nr:hypothetical protein NHH88_22095 [Oxalobacteraceae bacterium OTU3CAMAD1]
MKRRMTLRIATAVLGTAGLFLAGGVLAQDAGSCDRACLKGLADLVLDSISARDPSRVPVAQEYAATENSVASALNMMVAWQTATGVSDRFYIIDPASQQLFMIATLEEGKYSTLLYGRLKANGRKVAELELFENRSRGQGGFQYSGSMMKDIPAEWTKTVEASRLPKRSVLLRQGRSIFDTRIDGLKAAPACVLMENGKVVAEHPEVAKEVAGQAPAGGNGANADGTVPIPCGSPPFRPTDRKARTQIVDEVQGIVVSQAVVHGESEPYLATTPTESAFVPDEMLAPYKKLLAQQRRDGKTAPALRAMAATGAVAEIHRVYDNQVQGQHIMVNLGAPGARSPWVGK